MSLPLLEPTSLQDGETINLNLCFELTIVIFFKLTTFHICRPSMFKHLSKNYSILEMIILTLVNSEKNNKFYMIFKTYDTGLSSIWNCLKSQDYKRNLIMECVILPLLNVNVFCHILLFLPPFAAHKCLFKAILPCTYQYYVILVHAY